MGIRNTLLGKLSKQISKLFFQMSAQVHSVPGQTEVRRKAFLEWEKHSLILGRGGNVNYYKSVHHLILTQENREHPSNFENKPVALLSIYISRISFQGIFSSYPN